MSTKLELQGLEEFRQALRNLPEELKAEAGAIVQAHADQAQREIVTGYAEKTGNLKTHVKVERDASRFGTAAIVKSTARHAKLYEFGTTRRQTNAGANRGSMPKADDAHAMIPKVVRIRARMVRALIDLVKRAGFEVQA